MSRDLISIGQIVDLLQARAGELARRLLPHGVLEGDEWREARRKHGGMGDSLSIRIKGDNAGVFYHGATGEAGDALDAIAYLATNGDKTAAIKWARSWLGLDGTDPVALKLTRAAQQRREQQIEREEADAAEKRKAALAIYLHAIPDIRDTPVDRYLQGRGLDIRQLPFPVRALRFHPELHHGPTGRKWPGMVASIVNAAGETIAVHRTFLEVQSDGRVLKAPVEAPKMTLGPYRGGTIRLWRGTRVDPKTGEFKQGYRLGERKEPFDVDFTEGIEDGLTVALGIPEAIVLPAVSLGNMGAIELPPPVRRVNIWLQNDAPGSPAEAKMRDVIEGFRRQGREAGLCGTPPGFKDVNDIVKPVGKPEESAVGG